MTTTDLAALIEATNNPDRWQAWAAERRLECALAAAYRSGDLVLIERERLRERVIEAVRDALDHIEPYTRVEGLTDDESVSVADAAIVTILGDAP